MAASRKPVAVKERNFPMTIRFEYNIKATSYSEAKEIMFRQFLEDVRRMAASVETVEDLIISRNHLNFRSTDVD